MPRRGENIRQRKDGRWEGRLLCGHGANGKAKYKSVYSYSYLETKQKLLDLSKKKKETMVFSEGRKGIHFREVLFLWLMDRRLKLRPHYNEQEWATPGWLDSVLLPGALFRYTGIGTPAPGLVTDAMVIADEWEEMVALLLQEPDIRKKTAILLCLYSGIRRGEFGGLQWKDVDKPARTGHSRASTLNDILTPKVGSGKRKIG